MSGTRLITTSSEGLQPLGSAAQRSFELVTGAVRARLGEEHAALFAEPVASEHGDRIDWYAAGDGEAIPMARLSPEERSALKARLGEMVAAIRAEAGRLGTSGDADDQRLSEALVNALEIPGEEMVLALRAADGSLRPVLVHWAWLRNERAAVRGVLSAMVPRAAPAPPAAPGAGRAGFRRWLIGFGWLALAMMIAAILYLMVAPCGLAPGGPDFCPSDPPALAAAYSEQAAIEDEIAALEREIALADRTCQPVAPRPRKEGLNRVGRPGPGFAAVTGQGSDERDRSG